MSDSANDQFDIHETAESITVTLSSTMGNVDRTCDEILRFLIDVFKGLGTFTKDNFQEELEYSEKFRSHLFAIQLVMREGLTNAVRHGNCLNASKTVRCSVQINENKELKVEIEDQGKGFNWRKKQNRKGMDETSEHGRGLMIMERYFSRYWYNESGNKLVLEKNISLN